MVDKPVIVIEGLYKIFGSNPGSVMPLVRQGRDKTEIHSETSHIVGLNNINLEVQKGEIFVVMGLSGCGKSTFIRHLNRLIDPTEGTIYVDGISVMNLSQTELEKFRRDKMSMVFQHFGLMPHRTVLDNAAYGLSVRGLPRDEREKNAGEWLEAVGLKGYENYFPAQLSGGQKQRVGLARALCADTPILLMDEAFSALDPLIRSEMQDQLLELQHKLKKTIVFITHDLNEALRLGDRIAILKDGALSQVGRPEEILLHPADPYVEAFVHDVNRARALTVKVVMNSPGQRLTTTNINEALRQMREWPEDYGYVFHEDEYKGIVTREALEDIQESSADPAPKLYEVVEEGPVLSPDTILEDAIPKTLETEYPVPVVSKNGDYSGILSRDDMFRVLTSNSSEKEL